MTKSDWIRRMRLPVELLVAGTLTFTVMTIPAWAACDGGCYNNSGASEYFMTAFNWAENGDCGTACWYYEMGAEYAAECGCYGAGGGGNLGGGCYC